MGYRCIDTGFPRLEDIFTPSGFVIYLVKYSINGKPLRGLIFYNLKLLLTGIFTGNYYELKKGYYNDMQ